MKKAKKCTKCKNTKNRNEFHKSKLTSDGRNFWCKVCMSEIRKKYVVTEQEIKNNRYGHLKKRYGITEEKYNKLHKTQKGVCAICLKKETKINTAGNIQSLSVDHCHKTGKIRGLLCDLCNRGLGQFKDNVESLKRAVKYLKK